MRKFLILLTCGMLALTSCGVGGTTDTGDGNTPTPPAEEQEKPEEKPDEPAIKVNDMLYGMCNIQEERDNYEKFAEVDAQLMYNLGVGCTRNWMHSKTLLDSKGTVNREACDRMHISLQTQKALGIKLIGMNHTNFNNGSAVAGKPRRDISEKSYYITWLQDYYTTWKTLAKEFPEVEYWEIDNEVNNADFMKDLQGNKVYTLEEMADIVTDMLYYAARGIRSVTKDAKVVLGGITEPYGLGHGENVAFMELLYQNIQSGEFGYFYGLEKKEKASTNPDDYFDIACWHPYVWNAFDAAYFIAENNKIYDVIKKYEPEGKDVFFTEIGFATERFTEEQQAQYVEEMFKTIKESLPYVKTVSYFKMFDVAKVTWTGNLSRYGLFYDPHDREYTRANGDTTEILVNGAPKPSAIAFQKVAGGSGSLDLLVEKTGETTEKTS